MVGYTFDEFDYARKEREKERLARLVLDSVEFYDLMQSYRHASWLRQDVVAKRYEDVKNFLIERFELK